jgi:hypothetical protein
MPDSVTFPGVTIGYPAGTEDEQLHDSALREAGARLAAEFPGVPPDRIESLLELVLARTADATVGDFRVMIAERTARARLMAEA